MSNIKSVLVPISFSPSCQKAVDLAAQIAAESKAKLYVLNVYKSLTRISTSVGYNLFPNSLEKERAENIKRLDEYVRSEMKRLGLSVDVAELEIEDEHPIDAIINVAKDNRVDLLVLGHHEESKLEHILFGRNIHRIVDEAPCDVIITRTNLLEKYAVVKRAA